MSSTSDSRVDTGDRDPFDAEPVRNDPWATGPGHTTQDDQTERFVPDQRDPQDHDGHLYASDTYAEPETTVLPDQQARHDPDATVVVTPEGQHTHDHSHDGGEPHDHAHDHADGDEHTHDHTHDDTHDDDPTAVGVAPVDTDAARETKPHDPPGTYTDGDGTPDRTDDTDADSRSGPEVETVALPPAEPVAIVEPVEDRPGDFSAVAVPVAGADTDHTPSELKPGDVPVEPVTGFFTADAAQGLRDRWREAQFGFVDDPRQAVEDVKALVSEAVDQFTAAVQGQRDELDTAAGEDTEQYRVAVQRYRSFFDRLLGL